MSYFPKPPIKEPTFTQGEEVILTYNPTEIFTVSEVIKDWEKSIIIVKKSNGDKRIMSASRLTNDINKIRDLKIKLIND